VIVLLRGSLRAVDLLMESKVTDEDFCAGRHGHQVAYAEYAAWQRFFAMHAENPGCMRP
jgi:hypothetical protein